MTGPSHATPDAELAAPQPVPVEPMVGAMAPVPLMVGHAEDRAETDADARADTALSRLRRLEGDTHSHVLAATTRPSPGARYAAAPPRRAALPSSATRVARSTPAPAARSSRGVAPDARSTPTYADAWRPRSTPASRRCASTTTPSPRSSTAPCPPRRSRPARTSSSAAGSTTPAPRVATGCSPTSSPHTLQPDSGPQRKSRRRLAEGARRHRPQRRHHQHGAARHLRLDLRKKKPAPGPAPEGAAPPKPKPLAPPPPPPPGFKGKGGALPSTAAEGTKGGIVTGVVGGAGAAGQFGSAAAPMLGGVTGGAAGLLTTADALMGLNNADSMASEAADYGDAGMWNLAGRKGKNQGMQALTGAASMAKGGVEMGYLASAGSANVAKSMAVGAGNVGLGVAAGGLGVAVGSLQTAQGLWRSGKAVQKLCRLTWGRSKEMYSERGKTSWKPAVLSAEKFKLGVGIVKTALGVLGIAAGALLIVSNPIGWGIGIAAAIAGGVYAATKIVAKISDAKNRTRIAEKIANGHDADVVVGEGTTKTVGDAKKSAAAKTAQSNKRSDKAHPDGEKGKDEHHARNAAIERANEVARMASSTAVVASEMRDRMLWADDKGKESVWTFLQAEAETPTGKPADWLSVQEQELVDAYMLLSSINVSREEAVSPMGQELIEKKLSKMESM